MAENLEDPNDIIFIYEMVDKVPLSRAKKNIARDFSDGVLLAEVIKHYAPQLVDIHNYPAAHSKTQKLYNWKTLNEKVLKKLSLYLTKKEIESIISCQQGAIENVLKKVLIKITKSSPKINRQEFSHSKEIEFNIADDKQNKNIPVVFPENDYKDIIIQKDNIIANLRTTIEILELKITNNQEENLKLTEKLEYLKEILGKSGKL